MWALLRREGLSCFAVTGTWPAQVQNQFPGVGLRWLELVPEPAFPEASSVVGPLFPHHPLSHLSLPTMCEDLSCDVHSNNFLGKGL